VGKDNPFGHPAQETICRLEGRLGEDKIYLTQSKEISSYPERGTITFTTDGKKLWVETER
jgi:beta-lactamase superfamily II metal-dependent hydrolase